MFNDKEDDFKSKNNIRLNKFKPDEDKKQWQFISDENDIETIFKKLDWIAYRLMRLTITLGEGMNGQEVDEYTRLFK